MINHDVAYVVAAGVAALVGYWFGRLNRDDDALPAPRKVPPASPYRDSAKPSDGDAKPKRKPATVLFRYNTHDPKHVALCCPACLAKVCEMPVCKCDEVEGEPGVHFHTTCAHCNLSFAMETAYVAEQRRKRERRERDEKEKESPPAEKPPTEKPS